MKARLAMVVVLLVGVAVVALAPARPVGACSCAVFTMESALEEGAAAFVGVARDEHGDAPRGWTFDVAEVVKGELPAQVEVWQASGGLCGPNFEVGEVVGVVVRREGDRYVADDCGGVWLADELRSPGAVAAPTGSGAVALIAAGRSGPAMLASFDSGGNLTAWGLGDASEDVTNLQVCPTSKVVVGTTVGVEPRLVRRDVATLEPIGSVTLPQRSPTSFPSITDTRGLHCTSPEGDVVFLVSASGYGDGPADNVVVWVEGDSAAMHPVDHGWGLAPAGDGVSAVVLTGEHGTLVERITLADGARRQLTELPDGLGGRFVAVDEATGRLAIVATTNPTLHSRGDPAAPDDRLIVLDPDGTVLSTAALPAPRLVRTVDWLDADRLVVVWGLPATSVDVIELDGTVQSSLQIVSTESIAVAGDRVYAATDDGVMEMRLDGGESRLLAPSIAHVHDVVAVPAGPLAARQPTPTIPATSQSPPTISTAAQPIAPGSPTASPEAEPPATTSTDARVVGENADGVDSGGVAMVGVLVVVLVALVAGASVIVWRRRRLPVN
jgi:hypothetical protein